GIKGKTIVLESSSVLDKTERETWYFSNKSFINTPTIIITIEASTAGIALISIGNQLSISPGMAAGAIIAGAVFGDKMSPLSDT
nr:hypothetical protein [Staphylococcus aureus]